METATAQTKQRGRPFTRADPRIQPGPGRPALPLAEREARATRREVQRRVVSDLTAELKQAADLAVDALVAIVNDPKAKHTDRIAAASQILDRGFGKPVQGVVGRIEFDQCDVLTADQLRAAALRLVSQSAEDVFA